MSILDRNRDFHCHSLILDPMNGQFVNFRKQGITLGSYDYCSLMHYCELQNELLFGENEELRKCADKLETFSAGDKAAIRILYGRKGLHHGEWHPPISDKLCYYKCQKFLNQVHCGYWGSKGHWSCCMDENEDSECLTTHSGFEPGQSLGKKFEDQF